MFVLHHATVMTTDLARAREFYGGVLGLTELRRPAFAIPGAWFALGPSELHVTCHDGSFRAAAAMVDVNDAHIAFRTLDFDAVLARLGSHGYRAGLAEGDPRRVVVLRESPVGYLQAYLMDPDRNIIEINSPHP